MHNSSHLKGRLRSIVGTFRFEYEYKIEYKSRTFQFYFAGFTSKHIPILTHEPPSLLKTNMRSKGSGDVAGTNIKNRTLTQSHSRSLILRSLLSTLWTTLVCFISLDSISTPWPVWSNSFLLTSVLSFSYT